MTQNSRFLRTAYALPVLTLLVGTVALALWWLGNPRDAAKVRLPGADQAPGAEAGGGLNPVTAGRVVKGPGTPSADTGLWSQFRGPNRDGSSQESTSLARTWEAAGPRQLWALDCGDGYAGVAIRGGCAYLMDYDTA